MRVASGGDEDDCKEQGSSHRLILLWVEPVGAQTTLIEAERVDLR
jgi:hypothetical protein